MPIDKVTLIVAMCVAVVSEASIGDTSYRPVELDCCGDCAAQLEVTCCAGTADEVTCSGELVDDVVGGSPLCHPGVLEFRVSRNRIRAIDIGGVLPLLPREVWRRDLG